MPKILSREEIQRIVDRAASTTNGADAPKYGTENQPASPPPGIGELEAAAGYLINCHNILARFGTEVENAGLVGETRNAKILYLALTSRLFEQPISVAIKGVSSVGKSFTVEQVLKFFPPAAYFVRTGMSERALIYSDEDYSHRFLIIFEAAGMNSDMQSYLIRTLLSEGIIVYEVVEKTKAGLRPRRIEKEGPTGLITTTTAPKLHPENETRLLSLGVIDTPDQTIAVMQALAADAAPAKTVSYAQWHALQSWFAEGQREVVVPFAAKLADLIPPVAVRLRRDFKLLLTLVRAHALLHRGTRAQDEQGRIVATVADYEAVRELVAKLFAEGIEAMVPQTIRETVAAVEACSQGGVGEVSLATLAKTMKLDKSAAHHRVRRAIDRGYLVNREEKRAMPAKIATAEPLPNEIPQGSATVWLKERWPPPLGPEGRRVRHPQFGVAAMNVLTFHPLADVLPLIEGAEFGRLVADIAEHGLLNPITVHDGKILDGRNRQRACHAAGVEPRYVEFDGKDPAAFVLSQNLARRHLGPSERAMVAARMANLRWGQRADRVEGSIDLSTAAKLVSVSEPSVKRARVVLAQGIPELQEAVDRGRIAVHEAEKAARLGSNSRLMRPYSQRSIARKGATPSGTAPRMRHWLACGDNPVAKPSAAPNAPTTITGACRGVLALYVAQLRGSRFWDLGPI